MKKTSSTQTSVLLRYTSLPALLHLLHKKQITLLSPESWDDKNDSFFMNRYKERGKLKCVLALCFAEVSETYHHWRVFTHGSDGVCIVFKRGKLLAAFDKSTNILMRAVEYKEIRELKKYHPPVDDLPFLKRYPYRDEQEFRLVYVDRREEIDAKGFDIDLTCIDRIVLSPWMPEALIEPVKSTIHAIDGCESIKVYRTTLLENEQWKRSAG